MENASKALIIAGAILISILLITLGITLYNSSKGTTDQATQLGDTMGNGAQSAVGQLGTALGVDGNADISADEFNAQFSYYTSRSAIQSSEISTLKGMVEDSNNMYINHRIKITKAGIEINDSMSFTPYVGLTCVKENGYITEFKIN